LDGKRITHRTRQRIEDALRRMPRPEGAGRLIGHALDPAIQAAVDRALADRVRQGLPPHVEDPAVLSLIAELVLTAIGGNGAPGKKTKSPAPSPPAELLQEVGNDVSSIEAPQLTP
jgi:hypothetical protein